MGCFPSRSIDINGRSFRTTPLSEGGFSMIFLAEDLRTKEVFVLKKMTCVDEETAIEAVKEAKTYQMFNHPNIIKCIDYAVNELDNGAKDVYMILPFFRKGTLQDRIDENRKKGTKFSELEMLSIVEGACLGIKEMHNFEHSGKTQPIAHRDIKPGNILISDDNTPVLMDFGSADKAVVRVSNRNQALALQDLAAERCTMPYRAPELFDVKSQCVIDEKVDIWSLGCTIYSMAYGVSPFESALSEQGGSMTLAVINGHVTLPEEDLYSDNFREFILWILQTDPEKRPSIDDVLKMVRQLKLKL